MLTNTFRHFPKIGERTEWRLWNSGATSWERLLEPGAAYLSPKLRERCLRHAEESVQRYEQRDIAYFARSLHPACLWRLYRDFRDSCAFVDIETTGISLQSEITTVVLYDGKSVRSYINGQNLASFIRDISDYKLLVTYNGKCFDAPVLERQLGASLPVAHIDLRYVLSRCGLRGGLKHCQPSWDWLLMYASALSRWLSMELNSFSRPSSVDFLV
jgi:uncharacterized protein YprB with RNaseH-like and TPR domain